MLARAGLGFKDPRLVSQPVERKVREIGTQLAEKLANFGLGTLDPENRSIALDNAAVLVGLFLEWQEREMLNQVGDAADWQGLIRPAHAKGEDGTSRCWRLDRDNWHAANPRPAAAHGHGVSCLSGCAREPS